jgi:hypothetical protein
MPDVTLSYKLQTALRRYPSVQAPLKRLFNFFRQTIPKTCLEMLRILAPARNFRLGPPKGSFSIYQSLLLENRRPGRVVVHDQGAPQLPTNSLMVASGLYQHASQPWPIFWSHHRNARLVSSSLAFLDENKRVCRESVYGDLPMVDDDGWTYSRLSKETFLPGKWTSVVSRWAPNYRAALFSHWVLDVLPRLALLSEFPSDTRIIVPGKLAGYQKETLQLLGLMDRVRCTPEDHVVVEDYYFSAPTGMISCYNPYALNWMRSVFMPHADKNYKGPRRFIIQRKGKTRGISNDAEVNDFFTKLGWAIINTEDLTFAQEIELFKNAEAFAGVMGSGFTNGIWSSPHCKVIMFVPEKRLDGWAEGICVANQLDFYWKTFPSDHADMVTVDLGEVKKLLAHAGL